MPSFSEWDDGQEGDYSFLEARDRTLTGGWTGKVSLRAERSNPCLLQRLLRRLQLLAMTVSLPPTALFVRGFASQS